MKLYDVSAPIYEGMPVYKNKEEKQPKINTVTSGHVTESRISMDLHTGTHVDSPLHMINDGKTLESIRMEDLVGQAKVFDGTHIEDRSTTRDIDGMDIQRDDSIILNTKNTIEDALDLNFVFVAEHAASHVAEIGIKGVGIDSRGIERSQQEHPTHRTLFQHDVIIMEGLRLKDVSEGDYFMVAAPLRIKGTDASPARVLLFEGVRIE